MLNYESVDVSEEIDPTKSNKNKECLICHYWLFNNGFKFQDSVCNGWHDLTMLNFNLSNITIITVKNVEFCCIICNISKSGAINLLESVALVNHGYI